MTDNQTIQFIHPTEAAFARILDYYGISWQYEPKTFALAWDETGNITEAFTPDFFLPDQNLYIELTTLRTKQSTHKNRKLRRIQELYPDINIKLFKRRDLHQMMIKFDLEADFEQINMIPSQVDNNA